MYDYKDTFDFNFINKDLLLEKFQIQIKLDCEKDIIKEGVIELKSKIQQINYKLSQLDKIIDEKIKSLLHGKQHIREEINQLETQQNQNSNEIQQLKDGPSVKEQLEELKIEVSRLKANETHSIRDGPSVKEQLKELKIAISLLKTNEVQSIKDDPLLEEQLNELKIEVSQLKENEVHSIRDGPSVKEQLEE